MKRILALALLVWLISALALTPAFATPTLDATGTATCCAAGTTCTFSHTVGTASNGYIVVGFTVQADATAVTGVTYAGNPLTLIANQPYTGEVEGYFYGAPNSVTGANNVVVSLGTSNVVCGDAMSFNGVHQTTSIGTPVTAQTGDFATCSTTVTSATDELVISTLAFAENFTVTTGDTEQWDVATAGGNEMGNAGSTQVGAASVVMDWAFGASYASCIGVSLKPAATAVVVRPVILIQ